MTQAALERHFAAVVEDDLAHERERNRKLEAKLATAHEIIGRLSTRIEHLQARVEMLVLDHEAREAER